MEINFVHRRQVGFLHAARVELFLIVAASRVGVRLAKVRHRLKKLKRLGT